MNMARTPKARALGAALRQAREEKQMLLRQLAGAIDRDIGVLSRWETGDRTPKPEHVAQILTKLDVEGERFAEIMTLAYGTNEPLWLATTLPEQRRQMTAFLDWERNARRIVDFAPLLVPGILQTSDYIRAMMTAPGANVPASEVATRIATRIRRREALTRHNPAKLLALIGQAAFTQEVGSRQVMIEQLRHLLEMAAWPNVELRIVPDRRGWHPGLEGAFSLLDTSLTPASLESIVCVGNRRTVLILHEDDDVSDYRSATARILDVSLPQDKSAAFIAELIHRMESRRG
jgi:transcriptional regulator with XRE-family HTH domain